ncbi:MAG TPA: 3-hydroxybutyryl-CoA dehydrogenase [Planctomycetota bacterium]|nr:3-hydroxybutyryl-CoA dehydrogenase [Planctomycetota bacterium]
MSKNIAVIGAGTMGRGIAQVAAAAGWNVKLIDTSEDALHSALHTIEKSVTRLISKALLKAEEKEGISKRITRTADLMTAADCSVVIEAIFENEKVKLDIWSKLAKFCTEDALLASNTSSISITKLASIVKRPERFVGMHFFNPVPVMKLVEVVRGNRTSDETIARTKELAVEFGKTPVEVRDYPGFVSNRVLMPMINESIFALQEGVATAEAIDDVMKLGMAHPMGPLTLADFIGLDICLAIMEVLQDGFGDSKYRPAPLLRQMVAAGKLGRKSGEGFFKYPDEKK